MTAASTGPSCEAVLTRIDQELVIGKRDRAPDLPASALASVLDDGRYLSACRVPDDMAVEICAAVRGGRAVGVTVVTRPRNARVSACVAAAVRKLSFPHSSRVDVARTRFAPDP